MKKIIIAVFLLVLLTLLFSPYIVDNIAANVYKNEIANELSAVNGIDVIDFGVGLGNVGGTGNHTDMWVCVLVKSEYAEYDLCKIIEGEINIRKATSAECTTEAMQVLGIRFESEDFTQNGDYYIIEFIKQAPCSDFDLRGH